MRELAHDFSGEQQSTASQHSSIATPSAAGSLGYAFHGSSAAHGSSLDSSAERFAAPAPTADGSSGHALDPAARSLLDAALAFDFARVRIHHDASAQRSAAAIDAAAYTTANHIVFGPGQYRPETLDGRWLLAHEAFHVAHQASAGRMLPGIAPPDSLGEQLASEFADSFVGGPAHVEMRDRWNPASAGPAWEVHPQEVTRRGAEIHRGSVGDQAAGSDGTVSVRRGETLAWDHDVKYPNMIAIEYSGARASESRWLQFFWFEMRATLPEGRVALEGELRTTRGPTALTVDPTAPNWRVDSVGRDPFYEAGGVSARVPGSTTIFDAPGGGGFAADVRNEFLASPRATAIQLAIFFETYLIQRNVATYRVSWSATTNFTRAGAGVTASPIIYAAGHSERVNGLPDHLWQVLYEDRPGPWNVR